MNRNYNYRNYPTEQRFIWPILPFVGGAILGYAAGRPNWGYQQPYYQPYYPVYQYPYYQYTTYIN